MNTQICRCILFLPVLPAVLLATRSRPALMLVPLSPVLFCPTPPCSALLSSLLSSSDVPMAVAAIKPPLSAMKPPPTPDPPYNITFSALSPTAKQFHLFMISRACFFIAPPVHKSKPLYVLG